MRRFIAFILAVLVLVLSVIPCSDAEALACTAHETTETVLRPASGDNCPVHSADLCTPFCTCSCCAACTVPIAAAVETPAAFFSHSKPVAGYIKQRIERVALPIWQPPQLG